jgi:hypothetical protein
MTKMTKTYLITIPEGLEQACENAWFDANIEFDVQGAGCGSTEYEFNDQATRDKALQLARDVAMRAIAPLDFACEDA